MRTAQLSPRRPYLSGRVRDRCAQADRGAGLARRPGTQGRQDPQLVEHERLFRSAGAQEVQRGPVGASFRLSERAGLSLTVTNRKCSSARLAACASRASLSTAVATFSARTASTLDSRTGSASARRAGSLSARTTCLPFVSSPSSSLSCGD